MPGRFIGWILLLIATGCYADLQEWKISGVSKELATNIQKTLYVTDKSFHDLEDNPSIKQKIRLSLRPLGYFSSAVHIDTQKKIIHVEKGPPILIRNIKIDYDSNPQLTFNKEEFINHIFTNYSFTNLKDQVLSSAKNAGYIRAKLIDSKAIVDPINNTADITLKVKLDQIYRVKDILMQPPTYASSTIRPYIDLKQGDVFDRSELTTMQLNLDSAGLFTSSYITPEIDDKDCQVTLIIHNQPPPKLRYTLGLGIDSRSGLSFTSQQETLINSHAHRVFSDIQLSKRLIDGAVTYNIPSKIHKNTYYDFGFRADYYTKTPSTGDDELTLFSRYVYTTPEVLSSYAINYILKRSREVSSGPFSDQLIPEASYTIKPLIYRHLKPSAKIKISMSHKNFLSDFSFIQTRGTFAVAPEINNFLLISQVTVGKTFYQHQLDDLWLYRTGGAYSLRGYSYETIGPGDHLALVRLGLYYKISQSFSTGLIHDSGNASDKYSLKYHSIGSAFNWSSPVGNIQIYIAKPTQGKRYHLGLSIQS